MQQCRDVHPAFNEFLGITIAVKLHYFEFDFCLVCCEARPLSPTRGPPVKKATKLEAKDEDAPARTDPRLVIVGGMGMGVAPG